MLTNDAIVDVMISPYPNEECISTGLTIAKQIRQYGISCVVDTRSVRLKNKIKYAVSQYPYFIVVIGPDELTKSVCSIRDIDNHIEGFYPVDMAARLIAIEILSEDVVKQREELIKD